MRRNVVERKANKKLEIAKTEPESEGDKLLGSDGEMFEWSWEWQRNVQVKLGVTEKCSSEVGSDRNVRVKVYFELFDQLVESNAK